ncbi:MULTISPECIES: hypothetical protein [Okeania]|uniref:hypothetical protein n=1 Tax=Okeania TaxID=1458928 RepID=UPI0013749AA7|nr:MULTISPECIES: hypothetical protein [Okeania]NES91863.1 hypothetical protein [Okeania sp. SIO2B9]NET76712.1 hypothetical protein [Okeania sp. SIO1F9]
MANIKITELNSELMTEAIANAQARRNNFISELSEEEAAEVLGGIIFRVPFLGITFDF